MYFIEKNLNRLEHNQSTFFLDPKQLMELKGKLKKGEYQIYAPYKDSEKVIVYKKEVPEVLLYEVKTSIPVRHQDVLGTMYSLNIAPELFGDIVLIDQHVYLYILPIVRNYFESNFLMVRNSSVEIENLPLEVLENYERSYEEIELLVSSNRMDTVISTLIHTKRSMIDHMIQKREILLNYDYLKDPSYKLKEKDTFSVKRVGKFRYEGIVKTTKSDHLIIQLLKYL